MLKSFLKPFVLLVTLLFVINAFHHDIAHVWHSMVHIIHSENHHHSHHSIHSNQSNQSYDSDQSHHHHLITQFVSSFDKKYGFMKDGEMPKPFLNDYIYLSYNHNFILEAKSIRFKPITSYHPNIYLRPIYTPPKV